MQRTLSRRRWLEQCGLAGFGALVGSYLGAREPGPLQRGAAQDARSSPADYRTWFGDLHNHNLIGYAQGTLERTYEIARNHLDFFAFTPHAHWHDIGTYSAGIENKWINGFAVTRARWPEVLRMARKYDDEGKFAVFAGYEWHSTSLGDYHIIFPDLDAELALFDDLKEFQAFARKRGCILIPHHPANRLGHRGANFAHRDPELSPVLEMFSEWGNAEHDRAPFGYVRHTEGGRWTKNTVQYLLAQGHRMGFIASSDDHLGYPGAYREGLAAVKASELTRSALLDAIRRRRTYAVSGDRILLDVWLNGRVMGQEMPYTRERELRVNATGWNRIDRVEVLKNNRVVHRDFPMDRSTSRQSWDRPVLVRFDYGWGPWPALGWNRTADWDFRIELAEGRLEAIHPCFTSGPLDERRRDRIVSWNAKGAHVQSFTSLKQQLEDVSQKAVILRVRGGPETRLTVTTKQPAPASLTRTFKQLTESNEPLFTRDFPWESAMVQRVVFQEHYDTTFNFEDEDEGTGDNWYYVRVVQSNGQHAWSSPIWVDRRKT